jgi:hypothetical protein
MKQYYEDILLVGLISIIVLLVGLISIIVFGAFYIQDTYIINKTNQNFDQPNIKYRGYAEGTVESIHIGGRTEVVPIHKAQLEYYPTLDIWELSGEITQPPTRKNYFMPVVTGKIDIQDGIVKWERIEEIVRPISEDEDRFLYRDRIYIRIWMKEGKPIRVTHHHYRDSINKQDEVIADFDSNFHNTKEYKVFQSWTGD